MHLDEIVFGINSKKSMEETGSNNNMFLGWSIRTRIPNSVDPNADTHEMIKQRINKHDNKIKYKSKTNKRTYWPGDRIQIQDIVTTEFDFFDMVESQMMADDGKILSYLINMDKGHQKIRHNGWYLGPLETSHDPEIAQNLEGDDQTKMQPQSMNADTREKDGARELRRSNIEYKP